MSIGHVDPDDEYPCFGCTVFYTDDEYNQGDLDTDDSAMRLLEGW